MPRHLHAYPTAAAVLLPGRVDVLLVHLMLPFLL
jgi:hypothetical protein